MAPAAASVFGIKHPEAIQKIDGVEVDNRIRRRSALNGIGALAFWEIWLNRRPKSRQAA
ncbi:MAG: hypothetical protein ACYC9Z_11500 [Casimicrobiaceae bacterium]